MEYFLNHSVIKLNKDIIFDNIIMQTVGQDMEIKYSLTWGECKLI